MPRPSSSPTSGVYDVQLTVPTGWTVGATGTEQGRRDAGNGLTTHHYAAADVHDFAWTTSPDYLERIATFTHPTLPPVVMRLLLQPEHASQADRHFAAVRATLRYYGEWFGPYPYAQITIVDPAWQSGADGMEYPTLFTAGTRWLAPVSQGEPEEVTVHEAGHQFWYGLVANNEFEHAWMDEGVNTFSTARTLAQSSTPLFFGKRYFGGFIPWTLRAAPLRMPEDEDGLAGYAAEPHGDMPSIPSYRYWPATAGLVTYSKTGLWLATLERMVGWETMQRIMSTYFARFTFKHPKPADFFAIVNEISGRDFTWFFDRVYRSSVAFDYAVDVFTSQPSTTTLAAAACSARRSWSAAMKTACFRSTSRCASRTARRCGGTGPARSAGRPTRSRSRSGRSRRRSIRSTSSCSIATTPTTRRHSPARPPAAPQASGR